MEIFGWLTAITTAILVAAPGVRKDIQLRPPFDWALWGLLAAVVVGVFANDLWQAKGIAIVGNMRWIFLFFFLYWALQLVLSNRPEKAEKIFLFLIFWACFAGIYGIVQHFTGIDLARGGKRFLEHSSHDPLTEARFWRTKGPFSMPLTYAYSYGMFAALLMGLWLSGLMAKTKKYWVLLVGIFCVYLSLLTTYARGGWLSAFVSTGFLFFLALPRKTFYKISAVFIGLVTVFVAGSETLRARFLSFFNPQFQSNYERWDLWRANIEIFKDSPFFGVGHGQNAALVSDYFEKLGIKNGFVSHAHNNYLQILAGDGIFALFFYLVFILGFLSITYRLWKRTPPDRILVRGLALGALGAQINLHVGGLTENNFFDAEVNHQFIFILALVATLYRLLERERWA